MKNLIKANVLVVTLMLFVMGFGVKDASATYHYEPVMTKHHHFVVDSMGKCVRTSFMSEEERDVCMKHTEMMVMGEKVIYFGFDSAMLDDEEKMKLNRLAHALMDRKIDKVKIVGYTDRIGNHEYNKKLSEKRAYAVKEYLSEKVKLDSAPVELRGMGEMKEVAMCKGKFGEEAVKCLAPNRRVEIEVDYYDVLR